MGISHLPGQSDSDTLRHFFLLTDIFERKKKYNLDYKNKNRKPPLRWDIDYVLFTAE